MSTLCKSFRSLHYKNEMLILLNAWDAKSAILFQEQNCPAIGTSSAAVAASLGYPDGEAMSFEEYLFVIRRITAAVQVPVTVDLEMGYGITADEISSNIQRLIELGVAGINIEDSHMLDSKRVLKDADTFARLLEKVKNNMISAALDLFVNVRCDTYVLNVAYTQRETARRIHMYENAGADGIFLPFISDEKDIAAAVKQTHLPVNVMYVPGLPDFATLQKLGVKRVSTGPYIFTSTFQKTTQVTQQLLKHQPIESV